jgi:histone deacetylase complex regulatory component SIN3
MPLSNQMIQDSSYSHPDRRIMQQQQQMGQQQQQQQQLIQQQQLAQAQAQAQQQQLAQAQAQAQAQQQQLAQAQAQAQAQQQQQLAQQQLAQQQQQIALQQQQQQTALNTAGSHGQHVTNQQVPPSAAAMKRPSQSAPMQQHLPYIQSSSMSGMQQQQPKSPGSSDAGAGTPKVKDALGYLERVKQVFKERQNVYMEFLDIMKQFKASSINTEGVIKRVKSLFEGHNDLILGFNQFCLLGMRLKFTTLLLPLLFPCDSQLRRSTCHPI